MVLTLGALPAEAAHEQFPATDRQGAGQRLAPAHASAASAAARHRTLPGYQTGNSAARARARGYVRVVLGRLWPPAERLSESEVKTAVRAPAANG